MIDLIEIKNKIFKWENFYFLIIILFIFSLDRYSKIEILNNLSEQSLYLNDYLNLDLTWNTGIAFGLMNFDSSLIYNLISSLIALVVIILIFFALKGDKSEKLIFSLIIGGALGNLYDRLFFSAVPDFIDIHYQNFHWFTFNIADIFISFGVIMLIIKDLVFK